MILPAPVARTIGACVLTAGSSQAMEETAALHLESFEVSLVDIAEVPVEDLQVLSMTVGWPHRADDWRTALGWGQGVAARDAIGRVIGSAMWFPMGPRFATCGMVITSPRLQSLGAGRHMMDAGLQALGARDVGLNATRAAIRLYLSLGFVPETLVYQCQGLARARSAPAPAPEETPRAIEAADLEAIAALDAQAFGADRRHVLQTLMAQGAGVVLERQGEAVAYAFRRPFGRGHVIGPVVASSDKDAITVSAPHLAALDGRFARVDTRQKEGAFLAFLLDNGLPVFDTVTTMSLGRPWISAPVTGQRGSDANAPPGSTPMVFGLVNQGVG